MNFDKLSDSDREKLEARAETFGQSIGLSCKIPRDNGVVDNINVLYASLPNKIEAVRAPNGNEFINFGDDEREALKKKFEFEKQGYHACLFKAKGDATGRMIPLYYHHPVRFIEILFHEGFHNNHYNRMHELIEEAGAYFMGIEGAISFFNLFGKDDLLEASRYKRKTFDMKAQRFLKRYQRSLLSLQQEKWFLHPSSIIMPIWLRIGLVFYIILL